MKKTLTLAFALVACVLSADPAVNPAMSMPSQMTEPQISEFSYCVGYMGDFVTNRRMRPRDGDTNFGAKSKFRRAFNGIDAAIKMHDAVDVMGRVGFASHKISSKNSVGGDNRYTTQAGFGFGFGVRGKIYEYDNTVISLQGTYSQDQSRIKKESTYQDGTFASAVDLKHTGSKVRDKSFAAGLIASYQMENLVPYVGVQFVKNSTDIKQNGTVDPGTYRLKNRKTVGALVGASLMHCDSASLKVEGRFINETALGFLAQYCF